MKEPTIHLFADVLTGFGGIETYLEALALTLLDEGRDFRILVSPTAPTPFLDDLKARGARIYRQLCIPGDRWSLRQRLLVSYVGRHVGPGDWVFCVRQPLPEIFLPLVRAAHRRGAKVAASWMLAPEFLPPPPGKRGEWFRQAVSETDAVISVSECTVRQFAAVYGYNGPVHVVRYHNRQLFDACVPLPQGSPYRFAFMGRIELDQKNLDSIVLAFGSIYARRKDVQLHFYGGGKDVELLSQFIRQQALQECVFVHGRYDHGRDLHRIIAENHIFIYTSRFEGGPCLSLLELMQSGRYVVASPTGGIPDLYHGREDLGLLVSTVSPADIAAGLLRSLEALIENKIDAEAIRSRYLEAFDNDAAHRQFLCALDLNTVKTAFAAGAQVHDT